MHQIPFFEDLAKPLYPLDVPWSEPSVPADDEFALASGWQIVVPAEASEQVLVAATDLRDFLADAQLTVPVVATDRASLAVPCVRLRRGKGCDGERESYIIRSKPAEIVIEGADDSGIMYGVFHLEELLRLRRAPVFRPGVSRRSPVLRTRILRSPMSFFHRQELATVLDAYPENYLLRMAHHGFNGIWLRGRLGEMAKVDAFPEFGTDSERIIGLLSDLVRRGARYGIRVFLYFNEPLALPKDSDFFRRHPDLRGQPDDSEDVYALCTSTPEIQGFLRDGMAYVFRRVPGLAGVVLLTASEFHTHCFSHLPTLGHTPDQWKADMHCPRCRGRTPAEVIGEVVTCIRDGVKAAAPDAELVVWNWSWRMYEDDPQEGIIRALPEDVGVMADFERGGRRRTDGLRHVVDEYSLSYVGPSERFRGAAEIARQNDRPLYAKLQIGVTHEIATVPYFPVYANLARKFVRLRRQGGVGTMACWNFGNILSPNTELANWFSWQPAPRSIDDHLLRIAARDFGDASAPDVLRAWQHFAKAVEHYPFSVPLVYWGPQHFGPAYPLMLHKVDRHMPIPWLLPAEIEYDTDFSWMEYIEFGDQVQNYLGPFSADKFIACFDALLEEWRAGYALLTEALDRVPERLQPNAVRERTVCGAVLSQFETTRNVTEFTMLRNAYWEAAQDARDPALLTRMLEIAEREVQNALFCRGLAEQNPMLGFHGEAFGYDYTAAKIDAKVASTREVAQEIRTMLAGVC